MARPSVASSTGSVLKASQRTSLGRPTTTPDSNSQSTVEERQANDLHFGWSEHAVSDPLELEVFAIHGNSCTLVLRAPSNGEGCTFAEWFQKHVGSGSRLMTSPLGTSDSRSTSERRSESKQRVALIRLAPVFAAFAGAGALSALPFVLAADFPAQSARQLLAPAALSGGVVGTLAWALLVSAGSPRWRAPLAGALTGLLAHPPLWVWIGLGIGADMGRGGSGLWRGALLSSLFFSLFSAIAYGPLTISLGALVGWWLGRWPRGDGREESPAAPSDERGLSR